MLLFIGTPELILVLVVALLIFGPEQIPLIAKNLGKGIRMIRDGMNDAKRELYKEASVRELERNVKETKQSLDNELKDATEKLKKELGGMREIIDVSEDISDIAGEIKGRVKRK